ncbi:MAG: zinc-dependent alcohol dehydrogenase [Ilumatobacteraceae bacterium]
MTVTMRACRLHGIGDLRTEIVPRPSPSAGELLVRVEANGVCATDARKYRVGVNDGEYPFNPGHEWVGRIAEVGPEVSGWAAGERVYGDTYGGYADFNIVRGEADGWSCGAVRVPDGVPTDRAVFVEPLADCLHACFDQAAASPGSSMAVVAAGSMGLMTIAVAAQAGVAVVAVEPQEERRRLARQLGAIDAVEPDGWVAKVRQRFDGGAASVVLCTGDPDLVPSCIDAAANGGRVVLFAGFGDRQLMTIDLNVLHYREVALVGSEWIGTPPNQRRHWYDEAVELIAGGTLPLEQLVTDHCSFDDLEDALVGRSSSTVLKSVFIP